MKIKDFLRTHKWLLIVLGATFLVRLIYLLELSRQPGFSVPMVDEKWHWEWAHEILTKSFWGEDAYFRAPLYPYFLAFLAWITGSSIFWMKFLQLTVCLGTAFFLFRLAEHLFGRTAAVAEGLMYAFYGTLIYYESMFLIPVVFLFFVVWGMYRLVVYRESTATKTWLATGLVFGLAAISRPNILLVIPLFMIWLFLERRRAAAFLQRLRRPVLLAVGVAIVIAPVTIRNYVVTGDFILISSQGGVNLYLGNNEYATGLSMLMPEVDMTDESLTWRQFIPLTKAAAEKEVGHELSAAEQSSFWTRKALRFMTNNPGKFLGLLWKKTVYLLNGFENSDNSDIYYERHKSVLYSLLLWKKPLFFPFGVLLPLTVLGIYLRRREFSKLLPIYLYLIGYIPTIILFLVTARHRLPLVPFMILLAAAGAVTLVKEWKKLEKKKAAFLIGGFIVVAFLVNRTYYGEGFENTFQIHFNNGIKYEQAGEYQKAEHEYLLADKEYPYSATLINNLAYMQFLLGKHAEAEKNYYRALALKPDYSRVYNNLGLLVKEKGDLDSSIALFRKAIELYDSTVSVSPDELGRMYLNLARAYDEKGAFDSASSAFLKAVEAAPLMGKAYFQAAAFFARNKQYGKADTLYMKGMRHHDLEASDFFNWGLSLIERRRFSSGISMMLRALKRDQNLYQAHYMIAVGHLEGGSPIDTVMTYLNKCLELDSTYKPALDLKKAVEKKGAGQRKATGG